MEPKTKASAVEPRTNTTPHTESSSKPKDAVEPRAKKSAIAKSNSQANQPASASDQNDTIGAAIASKQAAIASLRSTEPASSAASPRADAPTDTSAAPPRADAPTYTPLAFLNTTTAKFASFDVHTTNGHYEEYSYNWNVQMRKTKVFRKTKALGHGQGVDEQLSAA